MLTGLVLVNMSWRVWSLKCRSSSSGGRPPAELVEDIDHVRLCFGTFPGRLSWPFIPPPALLPLSKVLHPALDLSDLLLELVDRLLNMRDIVRELALRTMVTEELHLGVADLGREIGRRLRRIHRQRMSLGAEPHGNAFDAFGMTLKSVERKLNRTATLTSTAPLIPGVQTTENPSKEDDSSSIRVLLSSPSAGCPASTYSTACSFPLFDGPRSCHALPSTGSSKLRASDAAARPRKIRAQRSGIGCRARWVTSEWMSMMDRE